MLIQVLSILEFLFKLSVVWNTYSNNQYYEVLKAIISIFENLYRPLVKSAYQKKNSYFSTKTYVVGTQKNRLNETVLKRTVSMRQFF